MDRRLDAVRAALDADSFDQAARSVLALAAKWSPQALATPLGLALEAGAWSGREAVFVDQDWGETDLAQFAENDGFDVFSQPFREQIEFFRQKRIKPTKAWTDALGAVHDRAFVIAGVTDLDMLSDFQTALAAAMEDGTTLEKFREDFDRIVQKYGWSYKGRRGWRTRVIFETNIRSSYMAGRLKQMRDPDVVRLRPWWQYLHGETRTPQNPRPLHLRWHGTVLRHDDSWWDKHFPPNGFLCSCGIRTLSDRDLRRMGKTGPDKAPEPLMVPVIDPTSGKLVEREDGIGWGWDYQPGHTWEQGLVPSTLLDEGAELLDNPRQAVAIDTPEPLADLLASAVPFKSQPMEDGHAPEDYVRAFLKPFGADLDQAVLFTDAAGDVVPVSDQLFRDQAGELKVMKRGRHLLAPLMAETLMDPDEIWVGVARKTDPADAETEELVVDRRYIRVDQKTGIQIVFEIGARFWEAITSYNPTTKKGDADFRALDRRRGGKLLFKRRKQ